MERAQQQGILYTHWECQQSLPWTSHRKKKLHSEGGTLDLQDHSVSEPEQTTDNRKLFFQMVNSAFAGSPAAYRHCYQNLDHLQAHCCFSSVMDLWLHKNICKENTHHIPKASTQNNEEQVSS